MKHSEIETHPKIVVLREMEAEAARLSDRLFNYLGYEDSLHQIADSVREGLTKRRFLDCQKLRDREPIWPETIVSAESPSSSSGSDS